MKISSLGEFGLIASIRKMAARVPSSVVIGMGDDAAALRISPSSVLLATTDMLLENIHFDLSYTDFFSLGWKSAAVNLSDIAAMGGKPRFCLTSLGIPKSISVEQIKEFYRGFNTVLRAHHVALVGGDTCSSRKGFIVNVAVLGESDKRRIVRRSGARPGDRIFVTGTLGDAAAGWELLKSGVKRKNTDVRRMIDKHLRPVPRIAWGRKIALSGCAHSMIDISDGLSSDLCHICKDSAVGAVVNAEKIPISVELRKLSGSHIKATSAYALSGGEDYELLFTVPPKKLERFRSLNMPASDIGEISATRKNYIVESNGKRKPLDPSGYDHFSAIRR